MCHSGDTRHTYWEQKSGHGAGQLRGPVCFTAWGRGRKASRRLWSGGLLPELPLNSVWICVFWEMVFIALGLCVPCVSFSFDFSHFSLSVQMMEWFVLWVLEGRAKWGLRGFSVSRHLPARSEMCHSARVWPWELLSRQTGRGNWVFLGV